MMQPSQFDLPSEAALQGLMDELDTSLANLSETQQKLMSMRGVAWSDDGLVKAEVGPRGQLIDVEIDPRVFRHPDSQALRAAIMEATAAAVQEVTAQQQEIMFGQLPPEYAELREQFQPDGDDPIAQMLRTDAEILREGGNGDA